jgi:hypothetical protein
VKYNHIFSQMSIQLTRLFRLSPLPIASKPTHCDALKTLNKQLFFYSFDSSGTLGIRFGDDKRENNFIFVNSGAWKGRGRDSRRHQNVGGVQALTTSHTAAPTHRKRCGRRL